MSSYRFSYQSEIMLDGCPSCGGIFVDSGELTLIEKFQRAGSAWSGPDPAKIEAARQRRREAEFGSKDQQKLPPEAAEMLAALQAQSARDREVDEMILRLGGYRMGYAGMCVGGFITAIVEELLP